jgi:hypothetical protein
MKKLFALALLFASPAFAEVGGYVNGGLSIGTYQNEGTDSEQGLELDTGTGFNLTSGLRFSPGIEVRLSYFKTNHDGGEFTDDGDFDGDFDTDVTLDDFRLGVFYYKAPLRTFGFRVGGGFVKLGYDFDESDKITTDGLFFEGAALINAGRLVTFDIGAGLLATESDDEDSESVGFEFGLNAIFHAGPVDIGVGYRVLGLGTEFDDEDYDDELAEVFGEFRITIGGKWGYPKARAN